MRTASTQKTPTPATKEFSANLYLNTNGEKFLESNFTEFNLPSDTVLINVFLSEFYFPDEFNYPLPNIQIYSQISPIKLNIDYLTLLWLNMLYLALSTELIPLVDELNKQTSVSSTNTTNQLFDASIECILPKVSLKLYNSGYYNSSIPKYLSIFCSSLKFTNLCVDQVTDLKSLCEKIYKEKNLCMNFDRWPFEPTDLVMVPKCLLDICEEMQENVESVRVSEKIVSPKHGLLISNLSKKEFKTSKISSSELFLLKIDNLWVEMSLNEVKVQNTTNNENTIVLPISFNIWLLNTNGYLSNKKSNLNDTCLNLRFNETILSESSKSFHVENPCFLLSDKKRHHRRTKSLNDADTTTTPKRQDTQKQKYFNSKLNLIIDFKKVEAKISHYQLLFLLRLLDELSYFQEKIEEDALKVVLSFNKELKTSGEKKFFSLSAVVFIDKLELKLLISDKRKFKFKTKSVSLGI
jgi:hypothetical protein